MREGSRARGATRGTLLVRAGNLEKGVTHGTLLAREGGPAREAIHGTLQEKEVSLESRESLASLVSLGVVDVDETVT